MVFIANTPESQAARLARKDSLNFDTTCHGIQPSSGQPCRRGFSTNGGQPTRGIVTRVDGRELFFCWQHKEQAKELVMRKSRDFQQRRKELGRSSIDTLVEKVEVVVGKVDAPGGPVRVEAQGAIKTDARIGSVGMATVTTTRLYQRPSRPETEREAPKFIRFLCCSLSWGGSSKHKPASGKVRTMEKIVEEDVPARPTKSAMKSAGRKASVQFSDTPLPPPFPLMSVKDKQRRPSALSEGPRTNKSNALKPKAGAVNKMNSRWSNQDLIPSTLPNETQVKLWDVLSKPFSEDDEPGYIYVFLLTDKPLSPAPAAAAAASHTKFLKAAAAHAPAVKSQNLLLKIGRAVNVQRRLHQWTQQCTYSLQLMRFYPYAPLPQVPRQVPNSHRIERLIHIELQERNRPIVCDKCGKTHLEWFEVDASREGLKHVDAVIRKWIRFGEEAAGMLPEVYLKGLTKPEKIKSPAGTPQKSPALAVPVRPGMHSFDTPSFSAQPAKQGRGSNQSSSSSSGTKQAATPKASTPKASTPKRGTPKKTPDGSPARRQQTQDSSGIQRMKQAKGKRSDGWESGDDEVIAQGRKTKGGNARR